MMKEIKCVMCKKICYKSSSDYVSKCPYCESEFFSETKRETEMDKKYWFFVKVVMFSMLGIGLCILLAILW